METKAKRGRPAKVDAKVAVSLRLLPDVVAGYQALGSSWRAQMEAALVAGLAPPKLEAPKPKPPTGGSSVKPPPAKRVVIETAPRPAFKSRLKGEWKAP